MLSSSGAVGVIVAFLVAASYATVAPTADPVLPFSSRTVAACHGGRRHVARERHRRRRWSPRAPATGRPGTTSRTGYAGPAGGPSDRSLSLTLSVYGRVSREPLSLRTAMYVVPAGTLTFDGRGQRTPLRTGPGRPSGNGFSRVPERTQVCVVHVDPRAEVRRVARALYSGPVTVTRTLRAAAEVDLYQSTSPSVPIVELVEPVTEAALARAGWSLPSAAPPGSPLRPLAAEGGVRVQDAGAVVRVDAARTGVPGERLEPLRAPGPA